MPTVSIGVPAHNEAQFIAEALDSVLAQELTDWQLTVSDNRSTDGTDEIVRQYAERDPRIRLDRVSTSVSQNENFNRLAREVSTPYFVWLGAHDRWHPTFLSECVAALGADERHVLAFTDVFIIDPSGERLPVGYSPATLSRKFSTLLSLDTRLCLTPEARFITFLFGGMNGVHIHGVIRAEALRRTSLLRPCLLPDITFVAELALLGTFARVEGPPLFELRMLREKSWAERALLLSEQGAPAWAGVLPWYHLASECVTAPLRVGAPMRTRAVAMGGAVACALTSLLPQLRNELREAVRNGFTTKHHQTSRAPAARDDHPGDQARPRDALRRGATDRRPGAALKEVPMASVTIGIPARNEGRFIAETLDSVLAQSFGDWELTVSDNASTDDTAEIVARYAEKDRRIRLDRLSSTVSQVENFNRLARGVSSPYFVWLGGHDRWRPSFLSECVALLEKNTGSVLTFSDAIVIDAEGKRRTIPWVIEPEGLGGPLPSLDTRFCMTPEARFMTFLFTGTNGTHVHGVIRTEALRRTPLMRPSLFPDAPLLGQLALLGSFARVEGPPLFECRLPRLKTWRERVQTLSDEGGDRPPTWALTLPSLHWASECVTTPIRADISRSSKAAALAGGAMFAATNLRRMLVMEVVHAARRGLATLRGHDARQVDAWMDIPAV